MITGYVINNSGKYMHIFKRGMFPGMTVSFEDLYATYSRVYGSELDASFIKWLDKNKIPEGFDIVVEKYEEVEEPVQNVSSATIAYNASVVNSVTSSVNMTSKQIAALKIKDDPKKVLQGVKSVHKLRRALSECKGLKGKATLIKYIKERISQLT